MTLKKLTYDLHCTLWHKCVLASPTPLLRDWRDDWQLTLAAVLPGDRDSSPSTYWQLTTVCNSSSRGLDPVFWPPWALRTCGVQLYYQAKHLQYTQFLKMKKPVRCYGAHLQSGTEESEAGGSLSFWSAWSKQWVPGQRRLHSEIVFKQTQRRKEKEKWKDKTEWQAEDSSDS